MDAVTENLHTLVKASMDRGRLVEANYALDAIAEISALRAAADGARDGAEWQPMDTAPRDTFVLLFEPHCQGGFRFVGYIPAADGTCINNLDGQEQSPTHWMPLPEPPADVRAHVGADADLSRPEPDTSTG